MQDQILRIKYHGGDIGDSCDEILNKLMDTIVNYFTFQK